ncbi:metallophosphoesterase [soil metagenome]
MKKIVHLSDLHFGAVNDALLGPLVSTVNGLTPDLVAVSGDLTQRARSAEFKAAREFIDRLRAPRIIVPGNHDIPLYNVFRRFVDPLAKYRRYVTDELQPTYFDDEIAVVGINTARSLTIKDGRINERQIALALEHLCGAGSRVIKIVVTHHPFDLPVGWGEGDIVGRAGLAMKGLAECGADLFLAGHMHTMHTGHTADRYETPHHSALVVQAGTATSTRHRGEPNSFNVISTGDLKILVERYVWQPDAGEFISAVSESFRREGSVWVPEQ